MFKFKPNLNGLSRMYKNLLDEPELEPSAPNLLNDSDVSITRQTEPVKRTWPFRIRKGIVLAFNICALLILALGFVVTAAADIFEHDSNAYINKIQALLLVILAMFIAIQMVGFIGAYREHILLTTLYLAFCIMFCALYGLAILVPHLYDEVYTGSHWRNFFRFMCAVAETTVVGWFLHDLYQMRHARKAAIQMQPMAMP